MTRIAPGQDAGNITLNLVNGSKWELASQSTDWSLIVAYRGLHCPVCKSQLQNLKSQMKAFADAGISVVSASMDTQDRAEKTHKEWELGDVPVAYGLGKEFVERFGLFLSDPISDNEPEIFSEPGLLLFKGTTYYAGWIQSIPFARPSFEDVLKGVKFIQEKDYPPRGKLG